MKLQRFSVYTGVVFFFFSYFDFRVEKRLQNKIYKLQNDMTNKSDLIFQHTHTHTQTHTEAKLKRRT